MSAVRVPVPKGSGFGIDNLPYGVAGGDDGPAPVTAIGDHVLDLRRVGEAGLLPAEVREAFSGPNLNAFIGLGRQAWLETRSRLTELLTTDDFDRMPPGALVSAAEVRMRLPFIPGDFVDFYSSLEHATNLGRMFRPDAEPLLPNWRHLPVAYHGRASSVVVSGTPVVRPWGQVVSGDGAPELRPTAALDFELEMGFVTGPGNDLGTSIAIDDAAEHIFGLVLVNDWSARDVQRWEYQPLGPFLGKSFATSVSPWVVTLDALAPYMVPAPPQDPEPLEYLRASADWALDIELEVLLSSDRMRAHGLDPVRLSRGGFAGMYWTVAQQLAHATVNGTNVQPGDLYASGTVSGAEPGTHGSLIEATWNGRDPISLPDGSERTFLEDGDTVILRGWCEREGIGRIDFGECVGTVVTGAASGER